MYTLLTHSVCSMHFKALGVQLSTVVAFRSLFSFSLAAYDARWLFRLAAHYISHDQFAAVFGGGGEKKIRPVAPPRPPRSYTSLACYTHPLREGDIFYSLFMCYSKS